MIFAILTFLTAFALASVAGWFSIIGVMAIYAGGPLFALVMGIVVEFAKLVTISWVYRNWEYASLKLKLPLIYFIIALMSITSIGVFGFLSKLHLEQSAGTVDNGAKIARLSDQIEREKLLIVSNDKAATQLDATLDSYLGKNRADRSVTIRKRQEPERNQLRESSALVQKRIDAFTDEKFVLESEIRKLQLDVGPIRYIAEIAFGKSDVENADDNIESAVRIFTLLIVSTLDPLAVILLIAANHTLLRLQNGKKSPVPADKETCNVDWAESRTALEAGGNSPVKEAPAPAAVVCTKTRRDTNAIPADTKETAQVFTQVPEMAKESPTSVAEKDVTVDEVITEDTTLENYNQPMTREEIIVALNAFSKPGVTLLPKVRQPQLTQVVESVLPDAVLRELIGDTPHFVAQKLYNEKNIKIQEPLPRPEVSPDSKEGVHPKDRAGAITPATEKVHRTPAKDTESASATFALARQFSETEAISKAADAAPRPKVLSWITEFKRT